MIKEGDFVEYTYIGNVTVKVQVLKVKDDGKLILATRYPITELSKNVCVLQTKVKQLKE